MTPLSYLLKLRQRCDKILCSVQDEQIYWNIYPFLTHQPGIREFRTAKTVWLIKIRKLHKKCNYILSFIFSVFILSFILVLFLLPVFLFLYHFLLIHIFVSQKPPKLFSIPSSFKSSFFYLLHYVTSFTLIVLVSFSYTLFVSLFLSLHTIPSIPFV